MIAAHRQETPLKDHDTICPCSNASKLNIKSNQPILKTLPDALRMLPSQTAQNLLRLGLLLITELSSSLSNNSLLLSLTGGLGLRTLGIHLLLEDSLTRLLGLSSVDVLNQCSLVFEGITLAQVVEFMVKVFVNLAAGTVLD